tara:strand:+ start:60 stop:1430 length:1371 start_codon:yes stop_codon:yes gene_type:complete
MIEIPSRNREAFEDVMAALGGDDYSYYMMDVKNIEEKESTKKVQIALKVHVPQAKRTLAADNIMKALLGKYPETKKTPKGTSLDVPIRDAQVIRIEVKPENSKGSGGGAAATKIQEAAQCVYAAIRYYCNNPSPPFTDKDYECGMLHCDIPGTTLNEIKSLSNEWQTSSWAGANAIYNTVGGMGYEFLRGDTQIDDGAIKQAFGRVKKQTNLSSEDKWNPADIWMVRKSKKQQIKSHLDKERTIDCLNNALLQMRADGDLIGISLKKIEGSPSMNLYNDIPAVERKANEKAKFVKYDLTFTSSMDVYLYYGNDTFQKFQARNFGGPTKGDWKLELKGKSAAQGKIQGAVLRRLLLDAGFNSAPTEPTWEQSREGNKPITDEIYRLLDKYNAKNFVRGAEGKSIIDRQPQAWRYSKLAGLRLLDWLTSSGRRDDAMKEMYLYASSQSDKSSVYWKLQ